MGFRSRLVSATVVVGCLIGGAYSMPPAFGHTSLSDDGVAASPATVDPNSSNNASKEGPSFRTPPADIRSPKTDPAIAAAVEGSRPDEPVTAIVVRAVATAGVSSINTSRNRSEVPPPPSAVEASGPSPSFAGLPGIEVERDFPLVGISKVRIADSGSLAALAADTSVVTIVPEQTYTSSTSESGPIVRAPQAQARGYGGADSYVAVIDTGADYTKLGCTAVAVPSTCPIAYVTPDFSTDDSGVRVDDNQLDDSGHGTNVSGIVAAMAPDADIIAIDVFRKILINGVLSNVTKTSDLVAAMQYVLQLRQLGYLVRSVNLSLGSSDAFVSQCSDTIGSGALANAGVITVAAAGNNSFFNGAQRIGIASPACIPGVVSVGATYDSVSAIGSLSCGDSFPVSIVQITCFSQVAQYLSVLAPGCAIAAGTYVYCGTSQASPHVAAAVAVLAGFAPSATNSQIVSALTTSGISIFDPRIGLSFRRLDIDASITTLATAIGATTNDYFDLAVDLPGASGSTSVPFNGATVQGGETRHGDRFGIRTAWFKWTAPATGRFSLSSVGSTFDTAMSIYRGTRLGRLTELAANDDSNRPDTTATLGPVEVIAGTTYRIAIVCGLDLPSCGQVSLQWTSDANTTAPTNDQASQAFLLGSSGTYSQTNAFASAQTGETPTSPTDLSFVRTKSVWFKIPGGRNRLQVSTALSNFDTTLTVYSGPDPQNLIVTGRSDDVGSTANGVNRTSVVDLPSWLSGWNWIAVDGFGAQTGTIALTWSLTPISAPAAPSSPGSPTNRAATPPASSPLTPTTRAVVPRSGEGPVSIP